MTLLSQGYQTEKLPIVSTPHPHPPLHPSPTDLPHSDSFYAGPLFLSLSVHYNTSGTLHYTTLHYTTLQRTPPVIGARIIDMLIVGP